MPSQEEIRAERARRNQNRSTDESGLSYLDWYRKTLNPGWTVPKHIEFLCGVIQDVIDGKIQKVAISTPPGHAKSDTITRRLPNFWGPRNPLDAIVLTGYNDRFAQKNLSYPARELAREMGALASTATALDEWEFTNGARLVARGVGSAPTGINPISLLIADDPIKDRGQANSEIERENIWQWWTGSIVQRFWPRTRAIIIATRWHEDDLIGRLKAQGDTSWTFINLPAIAEDDDVLGREPGDALWPEAKPISFLQAQRVSSEYEFQALFQGNPTPREGSFFKPNQIQIVKSIPAGLNNCLAWDLAAGENEGDWTAGVHMHGPDTDGIFYVDPVRFRHEPAERNRRIRQEADVRKPRMVRGPQDPGAAGKEAAKTFVKIHSGHAVATYPVSGDKQTRAEPFAAQVNAGNVRLLDGPFAADYLEEHRQFPRGKHDDWVDAESDAFTQINSQPRTFEIW